MGIVSPSTLSVGRMATRAAVGKFSDEAYIAIQAKLAPWRAEIERLQRMGDCDNYIREIRHRLEDIEYNYAVSGAEGLGYIETTGNLLLNEAWDGHAAELLIGTGTPTAFNNANARTGVGDSATAAAATQTDLIAASNKTYKAMVASYPQKGGATTRQLIFRSDFTTGEANYVWNEVIIDNGGTALMTFLRLVSSLGTKTTGTWTLTTTVTFS